MRLTEAYEVAKAVEFNSDEIISKKIKKGAGGRFLGRAVRLLLWSSAARDVLTQSESPDPLRPCRANNWGILWTMQRPLLPASDKVTSRFSTTRIPTKR